MYTYNPMETRVEHVKLHTHTVPWAQDQARSFVAVMQQLGTLHHCDTFYEFYWY